MYTVATDLEATINVTTNRVYSFRKKNPFPLSFSCTCSSIQRVGLIQCECKMYSPEPISSTWPIL